MQSENTRLELAEEEVKVSSSDAGEIVKDQNLVTEEAASSLDLTRQSRKAPAEDGASTLAETKGPTAWSQYDGNDDFE